MPRPKKPASLFRYFNSSPEVIRLVLMMYVRFLSQNYTPPIYRITTLAENLGARRPQLNQPNLRLREQAYGQ